MLCVDRPCGKKTTGLDGRRAERVSNDQKERLGSRLGSLNLGLTGCLVIRAILNVEIQTLDGRGEGGVRKAANLLEGGPWLSAALGTGQRPMSRYVRRVATCEETGDKGSLVLSASLRGCAEGSNT
jgi:hypothetical protein